MSNELIDELVKYCDVECDIPLSTMTTLRLGGIAKYVVYPRTSLELNELMRTIKEFNIPYKVLGKGSNILCSDKTFEGIIIRLDRTFDDFYFDDEVCTAQAGASIISIAYDAMKHGLSGLEFASGIPGSVGGVTFMNAGAYKSNMSNIIEEVFVFRDDKFEWLSKEECKFEYRHSIFHSHPDWIIVAVKMRLKKGNEDEIRELMDNRRERRLQTQPLEYPSAGSIFKNPEDKFAWQIIEELGYRGKKKGGAFVSDKHANFIVNADHATATEFYELVCEIKKEAKEKLGRELIMEVEKFNWD
ncbi:UDP-N-acetylmuramate dehydrogenase [Anaerorhabdus furcosa]|uniref:UDP-N-acetylenolpyruvoylglucosamine reductase n=1 Tax=Anaerorhabdus furcosa TaxID=118967 RepID=A0A1T4Q421_9FIRM|nr:UDP-N-acetylmuramate dehydrogenase [Anaerorhabdus furcosa]SJZ98520.1 UDP-N-acetylmuramate dehydrogenase [Anaerorhabdus furcosa]